MYVHVSGSWVYVFDCCVFWLTGSDSCFFGFRNDCTTEQTFAVITKRMKATMKSRQSLFASIMAVGLCAALLCGLLLCLFVFVVWCSFFEIAVLIQQTIAAIMANQFRDH